MARLHEIGFLHADLHSKNILVDAVHGIGVGEDETPVLCRGPGGESVDGIPGDVPGESDKHTAILEQDRGVCPLV